MSSGSFFSSITSSLGCCALGDGGLKLVEPAGELARVFEAEAANVDLGDGIGICVVDADGDMIGVGVEVGVLDGEFPVDREGDGVTVCDADIDGEEDDEVDVEIDAEGVAETVGEKDGRMSHTSAFVERLIKEYFTFLDSWIMPLQNKQQSNEIF